MPSKITPSFLFATQAEDAARYYTGIFKNSQITAIWRYGEAGQESHGRPPGSVLLVAFELNGQAFTAINGPRIEFNEAISFQVECEDQAEVDYYWEKLSAGGDPEAQQCGWVKDKFGVSWQIVPKIMPALLSDHHSAQSQRAFLAMVQMKKLDIAALQRAYDG